MMKISHLISCCSLAIALPATTQAAVIYNKIIVQNAAGVVLASVTATPAEIAANPFAIYYVPGVLTDPGQHGNYGVVVDGSGNSFEVFGTADGGPDGNDLAFALQAFAAGYFVENPQPDSGAPIDLTIYLNPTLQALGEKASFISVNATGAVPEPLSWAMMVLGFGAIGYGIRRRPLRQTSLAEK